MSIYLDDELPKNQEENDFFDKPQNDEVPYTPPDYPSHRTKKKGGCFFTTPLGCVVGLAFVGFSCVCIIPIIITVGCGALATALFTNSVSRTGSEVLVLENPATARLDLSDFGSSAIKIQGADGDEITLNYELTTYGLRKNDAQDLLDNIKISLVRQPDNRITVNVEKSGSFGLSFHEIDFTLIVPPELAKVTLQPTSDVTIENLEADFVIDSTSFPNIRMTNVLGQFDVDAASGSITFSGSFRSGSSNRFQTSSGDIMLTLLEPVSLTYTAQSNTGSEVCPDAGCTGSYGDRTSTLQVTSDSGDINIRLSR